ncbi:hypothetical protein H6F67_05070 [Microcoleus sp. FACHB-1515]|uniref:hypothetical protein n=1 Tax=Cyanophyceae TaxID=3028117 RepID=UPI0016892851|nr:hypothetical protein [Microcoleus sp. FACHB-1515]MBD2089222.1 hypothetical protein [Microcoleus sp. FACHB-1515]
MKLRRLILTAGAVFSLVLLMQIVLLQGTRSSRQAIVPVAQPQPTCTGIPFPQSQTDVSAAFQAAAGVQVKQITSTAGGNVLSYYDIQLFSPQTGQLMYNAIEPQPERNKESIVSRLRVWFNGKIADPPGIKKNSIWQIVSANLDGSGARSILTRIPPSESSARFDLSYDGKFVSYLRLNNAPDAGWDLYGFSLADCRERRITQQQWSAQTPRLKTSPATWDAAAKKYLIAFSIDNALYLVYQDGIAPNGQSAPQQIPLGDSENANSFHRIRLNPRFPHILLYRRNPAAGDRDDPSDNIWVSDWTKAPIAQQWFNKNDAPHSIWTPDGLRVGIDRIWTEYTIVQPDGTLIPNLTPASVQSRQIGPFGKGDSNYASVFYGSYSPDGREIAIATQPEAHAGGKIWLMNAETGAVRYLTEALSLGPVETGQPRLGFFNGNRGIAFSSDRSWGKSTSAPPQIYTITELPDV